MNHDSFYLCQHTNSVTETGGGRFHSWVITVHGPPVCKTFSEIQRMSRNTDSVLYFQIVLDSVLKTIFQEECFYFSPNGGKKNLYSVLNKNKMNAKQNNKKPYMTASE